MNVPRSVFTVQCPLSSCTGANQSCSWSVVASALCERYFFSQPPYSVERRVKKHFLGSRRVLSNKYALLVYLEYKSVLIHVSAIKSLIFIYCMSMILSRVLLPDYGVQVGIILSNCVVCQETVVCLKSRKICWPGLWSLFALIQFQKYIDRTHIFNSTYLSCLRKGWGMYSKTQYRYTISS